MAEDRRDYWAAFAIGAIVGVGATLLLAPEDSGDQIMYKIEPALKRARKGTRRFRKNADRTMNTRLQSQFGDVLDSVEAWFWGHEHNLEIYAPYAGLRRGRCIGCSAVPVFVAQEPYKVCAGHDIPLLPANPAVPGVPVLLGTTGGVYNHGYVILKLDDAGGTATVSYYQDTDAGDLLFQEVLGG